MINILRI